MAKINLTNGNTQWVIVVIFVLVLAFNTGITYNHVHGLSVVVGELKTEVADLKTSVDILKTLVYRLVPDVKELERDKYGKENE